MSDAMEPSPTNTVDLSRVESRRKPLFSASAATSVLMLVMVGLGIGIATGSHGLRAAHEGTGYLVALVGIIAAVLAFRHGRARGNMGTFAHAASIPVLAIIQTGLGEAGLQTIHITLGVLIALAAFALTTLTARRTPGA